jgi:hypothetical protein
MTQNLEVNLLPATEAAARTFLADLDRQIEELDTALTLAKQVRGTVARAFGVDRRDGGTHIQRLVDSANRSMTEIDAESQDALERALDIDWRVAQ